jgi:RNA polymerase sigma-70 factor (ECF subfamily)
MPAIDLTNKTDEQIFRLVQEGQTAAFEELYRRYSHRLLHYCIRLLNGNESRAQDLLQDVFLRVLQKRNLFRDTYRFSAWIFTITHNVCKNEYRSAAGQRDLLFNDPEFLDMMGTDSLPSAIEKIDRENFRRRLLHLLQHLSPDQRSTFLLRYQENLSVHEIAGIMNCPEGTVKSRLHYTLEKISGYLNIYNPNESEVI